jgi:hypothetical protein
VRLVIRWHLTSWFCGLPKIAGTSYVEYSSPPALPEESTYIVEYMPSLMPAGSHLIVQPVTMSQGSGDQHSPLLTSPDRLQKIDQLRERNIGTYLPLPQLVAVGDQSSGKSSLLESLTGIPFPRGQELCTRYATQITHRREAHQRIDISIFPGPHASQDHKRELELYRKQVQTTAQLRTEFPDILIQVTLST